MLMDQYAAKLVCINSSITTRQQVQQSMKSRLESLNFNIKELQSSRETIIQKVDQAKDTIVCRMLSNKDLYLRIRYQQRKKH